MMRIAEECSAFLEPLARQHDVQIARTGAPVLVQGDPERLTQVVTNLLSNAILYNRPGGTVQVQMTCADGNGVLTVTNTGVGIAANDLPHIFDRFYRVDKARSRDRGGSGLGLAICKSVIEAHGGRLTVQSAPHVSTTLTLQLPCS